MANLDTEAIIWLLINNQGCEDEQIASFTQVNIVLMAVE